MRWFWLFILALVLVTAGLYTKRVRTNAVVAGVPHGTPERAISTPDEKPTQPTQSNIQEKIEHKTEVVDEPEPIKEPVEWIEPTEPKATEPVRETAVETVEEPITEIAKEPNPEPTPKPEPVVHEPELVVEPKPKPEAETEPEARDLVEVVLEKAREPEVSVKPVPTYERLADGSLTVLATGVHILGSGVQADPFVLDWVTLRSIERTYDPKKGKTKLPDWLDVLDGSHVSITGNTLVPVIATTTRELLVMQNPWDGCCIGVPPSPYDAIEVTLNHDVDFGSSAVGYGTVKGMFVLDPYVVDGWVLGLYMIDDATYRSGEGIAFPDF